MAKSHNVGIKNKINANNSAANSKNKFNNPTTPKNQYSQGKLMTEEKKKFISKATLKRLNQKKQA